LRILLAESNEVVRRGIRALLEDHPKWMICGEAATTAEALKQGKVLQPDLLLLSVAMPDTDATDAIPQIINCCPRIKIVALTTGDAGGLAAKALAAGVHGLALTSEAAGDLILTVENVEKERPFLSPAATRLMLTELSKPRSTVADLTPREFEVFQLLARGSGNKEVAATLAISVKTVNVHRAAIMKKLRLRNYNDLVHFAIRQGIA
jgi:DNA-binding NarL/FixJ family response regulator